MIRYLAQFVTIFIIFLLGNWLAEWFKIPVPGSIMGMLLLLFALMTGIIKLSWVEDIAQIHIKHITLLFIPLTVGVFDYIGIFRLEGLKLTIILVFSSMTVLLATAFIAEFYEIRRKRGN